MKPYYPREIQKEEKELKEKCVNCGNETPYSITTNINQRQHYIEGAGQLCVKCFNEIYN